MEMVAMRPAQRIEQLLSDLTPGEKAELLQRVILELGEAFPGIDSTPDVCGGDARIVRTRIPVWVLVQARRLGASEADLLRTYSQLTAEDLTHAWACARAHSGEIDRQICDNEAA
jgi:uncharacterized protein (DUF433 family)